MEILIEDLLKIVFAIIAGGLIGAEREFRHREAGFRTVIFICLGATLFTMFSLNLGGEVSPVRIAAHMVTGVGFLCAGVIMEQGSHLVGLTTASTIWLTAAIGMGIGGGQYGIALATLGASLVILWFFPRFEEWIYSFREGRKYEVVCDLDKEKQDQLESMFEEQGLSVKRHKFVKSGEKMICIWDAYGSPEDHERIMDKLLTDADVKEFRY
jgi:putative Mg2+ transporter-C (MgtC) family protein